MHPNPLEKELFSASYSSLQTRGFPKPAKRQGLHPTKPTLGLSPLSFKYRALWEMKLTKRIINISIYPHSRYRFIFGICKEMRCKESPCIANKWAYPTFAFLLSEMPFRWLSVVFYYTFLAAWEFYIIYMCVCLCLYVSIAHNLFGWTLQSNPPVTFSSPKSVAFLAVILKPAMIPNSITRRKQKIW